MTSPVIVAGMHRSGTSLVASFLSALGVDMGEVIAADGANPRGYFEDARFLELDRRILDAATPAGRGGHRDWGWSGFAGPDPERVAAFRDAALALVEDARRDSLWGWKDPRASLLLDFWDGVVSAAGAPARWVLLYRYPWDVADSMQRLGADVFLDTPELAYRIWPFYNRRLLRFHREAKGRTVLASVNALLRSPERFVALLEKKLGLELGEASFEDVLDRQAFHVTEGSDPLIDLVAAASSDCTRLLAELDRNADLPAAGLWQSQPPAARPAPPAPDVSVITPCFDHGQLLIEAVASFERSAPESAELVIVNDGSRQGRTTEILQILEGAGHRIVHQANGGLASARNRGVEQARGRYLLPLDADNRLRPGFLEAATRVLDEQPEVGVVYGDCEEFGARSGRRQVPELDLGRLLYGNTIDACAVFRRELFADVGGYDEGLAIWEDWEFWIHAASRGWRFHRLDAVTFDYRVRPHSLVARAGDRRVVEGVARRVVSKHRELYRPWLHERLGVAAHWVQWLESECSDLRHRLELAAHPKGEP